MGVVVVVGELPPPTKKMETMPGCHHHHDAVKVYVSSFVVALHAETKHIFLHPSLPASQLDGSLCKEQRWPPRATVGPIPPPIAHTSTAPALQTTAAPTATSLCPYGQCPPPPLQHRPAQVRVRALRAPSDDHTLLRPITASLRGATHHSQRGPASGSDCRPSFVPDLKRSAVDVLGPKGSRSQPDRPGETARRCGRSSRSVGSWRNTAQTKDSALVSPFGHASAIVPSSLVKSPSQCRRHRQEQRPSLIAGYAHCWAAQAVPPYAAAALLGFETGA